ncbi:GTPase IMAP family member 4-like isoform X2 [Littorina saxatilis]|uniref:AIG1-type G domain-containing protein n=2 Tax=Littorina saxatilis TaxID=31220 RepID=A0AAN9B7R4_9CAEN
MASPAELRVVLLGKTGAGKSSLGNTLLGRDAFLVECSFSSVTFRCQWAPTLRDGVNLQVTDTPGVSDTDRKEDEVLKEVGKSVAVASPGPHIVLFVLRCGRFTEEEYQAYVTLKRLFGEEIKKFMIIVFTEADGLDGETEEEQMASLREALSKAPTNMQEMLSDAEGRYFTVTNVAPFDQRERQARQLLAVMQELVAQNGGAYFTNKLCADVTTRVDDLVQKRVQKEHVTPEIAATHTREAIVKEEEDSSFFKALGQIIKLAVVPVVGKFVGGAAKLVADAGLARISNCSVM